MMAKTINEHPQVVRLRQLYQLAESNGDQKTMDTVARGLQEKLPQYKREVEVANEYGPIEAGAIGAGSGVMDIKEGGQMLLGDALQNPNMRAAAEAERAERQKMMSPLQKAYPGPVAVGDALPSMAIPGGAGRNMLGRALMSGAAAGGENYVRSGGDVDKAITGAATGAIGNELGARAGNYLAGTNRGISRADDVVIPPEHQRMVQRAGNLNMELTPGQVTSNPQRRQVEASLSRNPFFSGPFMAMQEANQANANAIARRAVGLEGTGPITDETFRTAREQIGGEFEAILGNKAAFPITQDFYQTLGGVERAFGEGLTRGKKVEKVIANLKDIAQQQYMPVKRYQEISSDLAELSRNNKNPEAKRLFTGMRSALDYEFEKTYGQLPELRDARQKWSHLRGMELSGAVDKGNFNPSRYYTYLKSRGAGQMPGGSEIGDLSTVSRHFSEVIPNSGTPTGAAIPDFLNASLTGKAVRAAGGSLSDLYLRHPNLVTGPGGAGNVPHPLRSLSDIISPRVGRVAGQNEEDIRNTLSQ